MTAQEERFKYDVGFSFLAEDEGLALRLAELLTDRFRTFVFSQRQKELAGRDGEQAFADVFAEESRTVVVLYRQRWGTTTWTRIEETAIRGRAYDEGYAFALFVPLDAKPTVPVWLPKTRLWYGLERYGDAGLLAVIERLVEEKGGARSEETLKMRADRLARELRIADARKQFIGGYNHADGAKATAAAREVSVELEKWAKNDKVVRPEVRRVGQTRTLLLHNRDPYAPACIDLMWTQPYTNHIGDKARLLAILYEGMPEWPGYWVIDKPRKVSELQFRPDLNDDLAVVWRETKSDLAMTPTAVADKIARFYMDGIVQIATSARLG